MPKTTTTNANVANTQTAKPLFHKLEKRQVKSSLIANAMGNTSASLTALYAGNEMGLAMYSSLLGTMIEAVVDNGKAVPLSTVKAELDKFSGLCSYFKMQLSFVATFSKSTTNNLEYVIITPVATSASVAKTLTKEELVSRLTIIADSQMPELVEVLPTLSFEVLGHIYALSQKNKPSTDSVDMLFGIQDNAGIVKWFVSDTYTKACYKAFVEKDSD